MDCLATAALIIFRPSQIEFKSLPLARSTVSGGMDPRTSATVFLFEEFVPLEYRQQLSAGVQNKRTLGSFFSPGKTKQWKQATTLNGRPYVVGHVPRGLSSREVEFEGLLSGNNSSTKIISLGRDGPVKREVTHSDAVSSRSQSSTIHPPSSLLTPVTNRTPRPEHISSPLFVAHREGATLRPGTPTTPAGATKRRFRLPSTLTPNSRTSGLTPSVAEDIDFETRLASYSDDELNSLNTSMRKQGKHERRRSKDDAWVDILVASHERRASNQDAEIRRPGGPRPRGFVSRPDPEVASQEVAQVLAGVRGHSPPFDGDSSEADIEPMKVPHRSKMNNRGTTPLDDSYEPTIPESEEQAEPEEEIVLQPQTQQARRRMGYFDLHPERRPLHLSQDEEDLHELDFRAPVDNEVEPPRRSDVTESVYSSSGDHHTPPASPKPPLEVVTTAMAATTRPQSPQQPTPSPQTPTPSPRDLQRQQEVRDRLAGKPGPKAGALIEMYRQRERQAAGGPGESSPGKISSLSSAPQQQQQQQQQKSTTQAQAQAAKESAALPTPPEPELELEPLSLEREVPESEAEAESAELMEPPNLDIDQGRSSPYRYVHGAPLHNVVEEEEEE